MLRKRLDPDVAARETVAAAQKAVGDALESATLYGSAAMGAFDAQRSDVNVAFVFRSLDAALLEALRPAHRAWHARRLVRPLLLTREALASSRDAFPLEYLLIRTFHRALHGPDPFAEVEIDRGALRVQVERTLRLQEMALAWSYLEGAGSPAGARHWASRAGTAIASSASGLLHLVGEEIPAARLDVARRAASRFGITETALTHVLLPPGERPRLEAATLFHEARDVVHQLLEAAERLDGSPKRSS